MGRSRGESVAAGGKALPRASPDPPSQKLRGQQSPRTCCSLGRGAHGGAECRNPGLAPPLLLGLPPAPERLRAPSPGHRLAPEQRLPRRQQDVVPEQAPCAPPPPHRTRRQAHAPHGGQTARRRPLGSHPRTGVAGTLSSQSSLSRSRKLGLLASDPKGQAQPRTGDRPVARARHAIARPALREQLLGPPRVWKSASQRRFRDRPQIPGPRPRGHIAGNYRTLSSGGLPSHPRHSLASA